jgi:hypothetical protein
VNVAPTGTPDSFWITNDEQVTPNFQVYKSQAAGGVHQMLPFDWQPWCQINGNFNYAAIETAGMPDEPLTDYQMHAIASILKVYHSEMGMPYRITDSPGEAGFITHKAGGLAWGGHDCPGSIRAAQRSEILRIAAGSSSTSSSSNGDLSMADAASLEKQIADVNRRLGYVITGRREDPAVAGDQHIDGLAQISAQLKDVAARLTALEQNPGA